MKRNYLIPNCRNFIFFSRGTGPNMNVIAQLKFEFAYVDVRVDNIRHKGRGSFLKLMEYFHNFIINKTID